MDQVLSHVGIDGGLCVHRDSLLVRVAICLTLSLLTGFCLPRVLQEGGFGMEQRAYSETTAQAMDEEAKKLVDEAYT